MYSIRRRLTIVLAAGFVLLVAIAGVVMAGTIEGRVTEEFDEVLVAKARALKSLTEEEHGQIEFDYVPDYMPEYERAEKPDYFQFWLDDGAVLLRSNRLEEDLPRSDGLDGAPRIWDHHLAGGRRIRLVQMAWVPKGSADGRGDDEENLELDPSLFGEETGKRTLVLVVARGRERLDGLIGGMRLAIFGLGALACVFAVLLVWRVLASGFRPIDSIADQVRNLDADSLGSRVDLPVTPRELAPVIDQLNALLERLGTSFEWERRFAGNVAHELRTPIAELRSLAAVGARWPDDADSVARFFEDVGVIAGRMEGLVADLLLLARCQAGVENVASVPTDVREVVEQAWAQLAPSADVADLRFDLRVPESLVIDSDPGKLAIVFANLLGNAVSYARAGTTIHCDGETEGGTFCVEITNAADPMAPGDLASLTEAFWRGDAARSAEDHAGLGLSLVAALALLLGLDVRFAQDGDGTFRARLEGGIQPGTRGLPAEPAEGEFAAPKLALRSGAVPSRQGEEP